MDQFRIFRLRLEPKPWLRFLGPILQDFLAQFANLLNGSRFGFMSGASFSHGLIDHIRDHEQAPAQVGARGETLIQTWFVLLIQIGQFSIHEPLKYT